MPFGEHGARRARSRGLTLVEIALGLVVLGLALRTGVPAFAEMTESFRLQAVIGEFGADVQLTRSTALQRNGRAVMCKSSGLACRTAGGWEQGWMVFHDANANGSVDAGEEIVGRHGPLPSGWRMTGNTPVASYVSYTSAGTSKMLSGAFQAGTVTLCRDVPGPALAGRQLVLSAGGRPRVQMALPSACP
jgi:type IV fimbrial biogenesis protein FimT